MNADYLNNLIASNSFFESLVATVSHKENYLKKIYLTSLPGCSKSFLLTELITVQEEILVLFPEQKTVSESAVELEILGLKDYLIVIDDFSQEVIQQKLSEIINKKPKIILSTYEILTHRLPARELLQNSITKIKTGDEVGYNNLIEYLNQLGYQKEKFVEVKGEYSQRGSLIDFWSYTESNPVRLEFDGDFLESIRLFDAESQRSFEKTDSVSLSAPVNYETSSDLSENIFGYLGHPVIFASAFELENFGTKISSGKSELDKTFPKIDFDPDEEIREFSPESFEDLADENQQGLDLNSLFEQNALWLIEDELSASKELINPGFKEAPSVNSNFNVLFNILKQYANQNFDVVLTSENELQTKRLKNLLSDFNPELASLIDSGKIKLETFALKEGFLHTGKKMLLLTDYQIFNKPYRTKLPRKSLPVKSKSKSFASIKRGDFVVHENFGIGKYAGLETINIGESRQESMKLLYNEGGVVYVNLNYLHLVKRYSSNETLAPTLSTLGTAEWDKTKKRTKKKIKEAARELIELYAKRKSSRGFSFNSDSIWQKELEASFFYEDTPDQEKVTEEVKIDMEAESPMDRLVCGDVGFGKTEIAVRAAFKSVQDGKQVALLVPTTILAEQHYNTFSDRLANFPVRVAALSRFQTKKEQTETLKKLKAGEIDIIVGTHRLLSKDVEFRDIGLLIIDEEHRFGVTAKEKLRSLKVNVDTLTLTATPIPRTLNLSLLGARDLSIISTPPPNRQPIYTTVSTFDIYKIREWILNEVKRNGQVYFVHDRVQSIDKLNSYLYKYVPEVKVGVAHGQMKPSQLEDVIHKFLNRQFDVLLSTKIIESGIDIPNVNTIIVNRADRFGLAELHQLRGRVGRSTRQAYAYFIVPSLSGITKKALRRLQAIEEYTEIGSGFNLSMRDLEIRGAGNLLGREQSGFINEIGFDLYLKMIDEAVEELKYQEFTELFKSLPKQENKTEPTIDCYFELGIPETYMPGQMDRLNFYSALYSIKSLDEMNELVEEMKDRFGPVPLIVNRLLLAARLKFAASFALFERIIMQRKEITIILPKGQNEEYYKFNFVELMRFIIDEYKDKIRFEQKNDVMKLILKNNFETPEILMEYLIDFSRKVERLFNPQDLKEETIN